MAPAPLLKDRNFLILWAVGAFNGTGRWLEMLVIAVFVLQQTGSPFWVASMFMLRLLPMALFGLFGGVIAHRFERFGILRIASVALTTSAVVVLVLASNDALAVWHAGVISFLSGLVWSMDFPVRRTLMSDIAGPQRVSRAMSLDILAGAVTRTLGPVLGGVLYQQLGLQGAFALAAGVYGLGLMLLFLRVPAPTAHSVVTESVRDNLRQGWLALRQHPTLPGILVVTVIFNIWGFPFVSMVPVFAKEILHLNDALTGLFVAAEGAGALLGAIGLSVYTRSEYARYLYSGAVVAYCMFALAFSLSGWTLLSAALLFVVGFVSAAFAAMQSALILINAPQGYQRQMMGVLAVCIGTAPIGLLHIGLLADWLGAPMACALTAVQGLLAMGLALWRWPALFSLQAVESKPDSG